jgi:hypothetical protein
LGKSYQLCEVQLVDDRIQRLDTPKKCEIFARNAINRARHIITDHDWKILLDRGLDIFQHYDMGDALSFSNCLQQQRQCKAFEITYLKL